jgi:PKD repeat protein
VGQPGDQIAIYNSRTIYAQYTQIITYTVTLDLNGALYLPNYPSQVPTISSISGMYNGGETYNLATNTANMQSDKVFANAAGSPSMQGRFLGWSESPSGSVIGYSTFTVTSNKTLYAIWDTTTAVISFDVNGGTGSVAPISTTVGQEYTLPGANGISNGELMLLGWSLTSDGAETISSGVTQTAVGNAKWYAQWGAGTSPIASFIYSVNGLEVTFTDTSIAPNIWQWAFGDTTISTSQNPVHTYPAAGTYTVTQAVSNATGLSSSFSAAVTVGGSADVTYIVTFDANGGTAAEPIQCAGGGVITLPETTKSGVTFAGWCLSEIFVGNAGSLYTVNGDVTLTAAWLSGSVSVHSVVFKIDGQTVATQKVADGGVATHFSAEQSGKTFDGWYITDPEIFGGNVQLYSFATPVTKDITLDAHFTDNPLIDLHDIKTQVAIVITILIVIVAVAAVIRWMR